MLRVLSAWTFLLAVLIVSTSIYGGLHFYSPIPFWDQWDGQVGFYERFSAHPFAALWAQHNEHRIVFSRLLFLIAKGAFGGTNAFLVVVNYLLAAGTAAVFASEYLRNGDQRLPRTLVVSLIVGLLLLWTQENNLDWGFQSGSLGVNFFAVWAFAQFARGRVAIPILLTVAATLTMGNGIVGFGALAGMVIIQRAGWRKFLVVVASGALAFLAYFHGYEATSPVAAPGAAHIALAQPKFFAIFLGSPISYVVADLRICAALGIATFTIFSAISLYLVYTKQVTPYRAFLIGTYAFIVVSAIGVAHGRWIQGLDNATSSRYTTPALVGLVAGLLLVFDFARARISCATAVLSAVLLTMLATYQKTAFHSNDALYFHKLAVLGQKIGLDRPDYDAMIYPAYMHDRFVAIATYGASHQVGVYGDEWLKNAGSVKVETGNVEASACLGNLEATSSSSGKMVLSGWASNGSRADKLIVITDGTGATVGYGVTGIRRPDVKKVIANAPADAGWMAIANVTRGPLSAYIYSDGHFCRFH